MKVIDLKGDEALQGDVCIFRIPDSIALSITDEIQPKDGWLTIAEGELTGHHHSIFNPQPTFFHDEAMARGEAPFKATTKKDKVGSAKLYRDPAAISALVSGGHLLRADLAVGILVVEDAPVMLSHQEHDTIRLPVGRYYVGGQVESAGADDRRVAD